MYSLTFLLCKNMSSFRSKIFTFFLVTGVLTVGFLLNFMSYFEVKNTSDLSRTATKDNLPESEGILGKKFIFNATRKCTQDERKYHFKKMCEKYRKNLRKKSTQFMVNTDRNVAYCAIPKNSCSTWNKLLAITTNIGKNLTWDFSSHDHHELKRRHVKAMHQSQFKNKNKTIKFLIFRHPLARFLSAHYEKLVRPYSESFAKSNKAIAAKIELRRGILRRLGKIQNSNFPHPVSLTDFVDYVTNYKHGSVENVQWKLQASFCNFCDERYNCVHINLLYQRTSPLRHHK